MKYWINRKRFKLFVLRKPEEIKPDDGMQSWHNVDSKKNPTDLLIRTLPPPEFKYICYWFQGPSANLVSDEIFNKHQISGSESAMLATQEFESFSNNNV